MNKNQEVERIWELPQLVYRYRPSMVRFEVKTDEGDLQMGAGFHIGDGYIATAKHNIEQNYTMCTEQHATNCSIEEARQVRRNNDSVEASHLLSILSKEKEYRHPSADVAVVKTNFNLDLYMDPRHPIIEKDGSTYKKIDHCPIAQICDDIVRDSPCRLMPVVLMGYPQISNCNDAVLVAVHAEVNAVIERRYSSYLHFITSAIPRGGFSGAPILDQLGRVIAIVAESLYADQKPIETGFSSAVSVDPLIELLLMHKIFPGSNAEWLKELST